MKKEITEILNDNEWWQPDMIIEEKEPFFWRLSPRWVKEKSNAIYKLLKEKK